MTFNDSVLQSGEKIIFALRELYLQQGYTPYRMSKFEEYDLYARNKDFLVSDQVITFTDVNGRLMALKPDVTLSIIKNSKDQPTGLQKLFYNENVYRVAKGANGSDEILNFAFMAFCDETHPAVFPDVTYGFYPVFAELNRVPYREIPLKTDFSVDIRDYLGAGGTIFLANPNAPTGLALTLEQIEEILKANPDNVVVIDEAYVDFGAESAAGLIHRYDNLLVTQTFSKSRSLAGGRLGFGLGCKALIRDLNTIKYSTNPYNINSMTMAAGIGALRDEDYFQSCCRSIQENRAWTAAALESLGFAVLPSRANFLFARHEHADGKALYLKLKEMGILVRHFDKERLRDYNRITIGSREQMQALMDALQQILEEKT